MEKGLKRTGRKEFDMRVPMMVLHEEHTGETCIGPKVNVLKWKKRIEAAFKGAELNFQEENFEDYRKDYEADLKRYGYDLVY